MKIILLALAILFLLSFAACYASPFQMPHMPYMGWFSGPFAFVGWLVGLALYFLPTIIALIRKKSNLVVILLINIFLGWTLVGWIVALVFAVI
jgi:hypothetical protein